MKIISVQNSKGGVGKTTLAINIAACLARQNKKVCFYDADSQRTAFDWYSIKKDSSFNVVPIDNPKLLESQINELRFDYCIIDNPPAISSFFITSIKLANYIIVPVSSSAFDMWGLVSMVETLNIINADFDVLFIHNKFVQNAKMNKEVKDAFAEIRLNKKSEFFDVFFRQSYPRTAMDGETVFNSNDSKAQAEIEFIVNYLLRQGD
ncbi:MAG: hypothetical protein EVJ48_02915 [Candidatus Acidulodesulfobacterium acidiphilum]|uniref:CobQ/CobB/MinD/ParA nucleotide binding domain-containing protein n=1 Tax=Candidatus Acidulodesulfobacterium acidiphilum TaxID=2597224 RepID=A0A520XFD8_9DELT|nr:MAG: hypothetical protein EVJ48_02915 [Candidatus Acidulodesulfobacterium acidiphilum]